MSAGPVFWNLPGKDRRDRHAECGKFATWGHSRDGNWDWRRGRRGCGAYECPANLATKTKSDYRWRNAYTTRQARRIKRRLGKRSQHGVISPPGPEPGKACPPPTDPREYRKLRAQAYANLRAVGVSKAALFPHPYRCVEADRKGGHDGFHFHFQTPCRIDPEAVRTMHARTGWIVKGLGFKPTLRVAIYELHHVGRFGARVSNPARKSNLKFETEAVTWFGEWSKTPDPDSGGIECPVCHEIVPRKMWYELIWNGSGPPPKALCGVGGPWRFPERAGRHARSSL